MPREIVRFGLIGIANTLIDWAIYIALTRLTIFFASALISAKVIAFVAASLFSFFANRQWTFDAAHSIETSEFVRFYITTGSSMLINAWVLSALLPYTGSDLIALVGATGITAVWNFILLKFWVYKQLKPKPII